MTKVVLLKQNVFSFAGLDLSLKFLRKLSDAYPDFGYKSDMDALVRGTFERWCFGRTFQSDKPRAKTHHKERTHARTYIYILIFLHTHTGTHTHAHTHTHTSHPGS